MQHYNAIPEISSVGVSKLSFQRGWTASMHAHVDLEELIFITDGEVTLRAQEKTYNGAPGTIFAYARNLPHSEACVGRAKLDMYCLGWRYADPSFHSRLPISGFDDTGRVRSTLDWMQEVSAGDSPGRQDVLKGLMRALMHELARPHSVPIDPRLQRAKTHVQERLAGSLRLDELAAVAGMSPFHFAHVFKKATGRPPAQFVREQRIEAVRRLLLTSDMPLRAIAPMVGFADEHELSRVFRRVTGSTPTSIRAAARGEV